MKNNIKFVYLYFLVLFVLFISGLIYVENKSNKDSDEDWTVHTVCGESVDQIKGIDVSYYQRDIDWKTAKENGIVFGVARVSDGTHKIDPKFERNWDEMKKQGVIRGAYQFFRPNQDPIAQAELFMMILNSCGGLEDGDMPPTIDLEVTGGVSNRTIIDNVGIWIKYIEQKTNRKPIIYTGPAFWDSHYLGTTFKSYPLWVAHYTTKECPWVPDAWNRWMIWQYTGSGAVNGVPIIVDINYFDGSVDDLRFLVENSKIIKQDSGNLTDSDTQDVDTQEDVQEDAYVDVEIDTLTPIDTDDSASKPNNTTNGCSCTNSSNRKQTMPIMIDWLL